MKRKDYNQPTMQCVELRQQQLLSGSNSSTQGELTGEQTAITDDWN